MQAVSRRLQQAMQLQSEILCRAYCVPKRAGACQAVVLGQLRRVVSARGVDQRLLSLALGTS